MRTLLKTDCGTDGSFYSTNPQRKPWLGLSTHRSAGAVVISMCSIYRINPCIPANLHLCLVTEWDEWRESSNDLKIAADPRLNSPIGHLTECWLMLAIVAEVPTLPTLQHPHHHLPLISGDNYGYSILTSITSLKFYYHKRTTTDGYPVWSANNIGWRNCV